MYGVSITVYLVSERGSWRGSLELPSSGEPSHLRRLMERVGMEVTRFVTTELLPGKYSSGVYIETAPLEQTEVCRKSFWQLMENMSAEYAMIWEQEAPKQAHREGVTNG